MPFGSPVDLGLMRLPQISSKPLHPRLLSQRPDLALPQIRLTPRRYRLRLGFRLCKRHKLVRRECKRQPQLPTSPHGLPVIQGLSLVVSGYLGGQGTVRGDGRRVSRSRTSGVTEVERAISEYRRVVDGEEAKDAEGIRVALEALRRSMASGVSVI
jgi:hypothetical protein